MLVGAKGFAVGFLIAAPVGPIGLLCIRRTLQSGWATGSASGLGAALADGLYAAVAAFGLTAITGFLSSTVRVFHVAGAVALVLLGVQAMRTAAARSQQPVLLATATARPARAKLRLVTASASTLALTLVNPATILSFAAAFALISARLGPLPAKDAALFVFGAFWGSAGWWLVLVSLVSAVRNRLSGAALRWVNFASGVGLVAFAVLMCIV